jgi:hypothetical protein
MNDNNRYKSTIIGMLQINNSGISNPQLIKKTYLISFPFQVNDLNFSAKSGNSATKRSDITTIIGSQTAG